MVATDMFTVAVPKNYTGHGNKEERLRKAEVHLLLALGEVKSLEETAENEEKDGPGLVKSVALRGVDRAMIAKSKPRLIAKFIKELGLENSTSLRRELDRISFQTLDAIYEAVKSK